MNFQRSTNLKQRQKYISEMNSEGPRLRLNLEAQNKECIKKQQYVKAQKNVKARNKNEEKCVKTNSENRKLKVKHN